MSTEYEPARRFPVYDEPANLDTGSGPAPQMFVDIHGVDIVAAYREDYTHLMVAIAVRLLSAGIFVLHSMSGFRRMFENLFERMAVIGPQMIKKQSKKIEAVIR